MRLIVSVLSVARNIQNEEIKGKVKRDIDVEGNKRSLCWIGDISNEQLQPTV